MGLRKLKEYRKAPQMRVLKYEPDEKTKFPPWMVVVLMIALLGSVLFVVNTSENADDETLEEFVEWSKENKGERRMFFLTRVSEKMSEQIKDSTGLYMQGFEWNIYSDDVIHIFKKHGNFNTENARGQKNIEPNDFKRLYSIINAPDKIIDTLNIKSGVRFLILEKRFDYLKYIYISTISNKRKMLTGKTLYIKRLPK